MAYNFSSRNFRAKENIFLDLLWTKISREDPDWDDLSLAGIPDPITMAREQTTLVRLGYVLTAM